MGGDFRVGVRVGVGVEAGDGEGSVEVFSDLGDYPIISEGPSVHPRDAEVVVAPFHKDGVAEAGD